LKREGTLAVLFLAGWCPFCVRFQTTFGEAAKKSAVPWACADVSDDDNVLWDIFSIHTVPTVAVFRNGKVVFRIDGVRGRGLSQKDIEETIGKMKVLG
jgi:thioredoxin-like negative regulator of GroEL